MADPLRIRCRGDDGYRSITIRVQKSLLREIDRIAGETNDSRNHIIQLLLEYGVQNIEILPP